MTNAAKIIIEQAKALPVADREDIFEAMLVSLREVPPGDVDGAWRALLDELLAWCTQPRYCYRHTWQQGDMVIWNNPALLHRAHHYTVDSGRLMHRTTIMGCEAFA